MATIPFPTQALATKTAPTISDPFTDSKSRGSRRISSTAPVKNQKKATQRKAARKLIPKV